MIKKSSRVDGKWLARIRQWAVEGAFSQWVRFLPDKCQSTKPIHSHLNVTCATYLTQLPLHEC